MRSSVASTRDRIGPTQVRPFDRREASRDQTTCYAISAVLAIIAVTSRRRPASPFRCGSCGASRSLVGTDRLPGLLGIEPARSIGYVGTAAIWNGFGCRPGASDRPGIGAGVRKPPMNRQSRGRGAKNLGGRVKRRLVDLCTAR